MVHLVRHAYIQLMINKKINLYCKNTERNQQKTDMCPGIKFLQKDASQ